MFQVWKLWEKYKKVLKALAFGTFYAVISL